MNGLEESSTTPTRCHVRVVIIDGCAIVVRPVWSRVLGRGPVGARTSTRGGYRCELGGRARGAAASTHGRSAEFTSIDRIPDYRHTSRRTAETAGQVMTTSSIAGTKRFARARGAKPARIARTSPYQKSVPLATCALPIGALPKGVCTYLLTYLPAPHPHPARADHPGL